MAAIQRIRSIVTMLLLRITGLRRLGALAGIAIYLLVTLGPAAWLGLRTVAAILTGWGTHDLTALPILLGSRALGLLGHSLGLAALVTTGSTLLGLGGALWVVTQPAWLSRLARKLYLIPFIIPGYIYALTWLSLLSRSSVLAPGFERLFGRLPSPYGLNGAVLIMALAYAPLVMLVVVFALALVEYGVPALLEFNVYPMEIYAEFSQSGDPLRALLLALPVLISQPQRHRQEDANSFDRDHHIIRRGGQSSAVCDNQSESQFSRIGRRGEGGIDRSWVAEHNRRATGLFPQIRQGQVAVGVATQTAIQRDQHHDAHGLVCPGIRHRRPIATVMTTSSGSEANPRLSVTVSVKVSTVGSSGAVKVFG